MNRPDSVSELHHDVPMPLFQRILFIVAGGFAIVASTWGLWPGAWPLNMTSSLFLLIIAGAWFVGLPLIAGGLFGDTVLWRVAPGSISITTRNPFWQRSHLYHPADVTSLSVEEVEWDSREPTWRVAMTTSDDRTHKTPNYDNRGEAEWLKDKIEEILETRQ